MASYWEDKWEKLRFVIVCLLCAIAFCFAGIGIKIAIMPSEFAGYYLSHGMSGYSIMENWTNAVDVTAFTSYNAEETLAVYAALSALEGVRNIPKTPANLKIREIK